MSYLVVIAGNLRCDHPGVIDRATREEEAGPCLPYELFCDAQGAEYHPARVVRVGWVCQSLAVNVNKYRIWEDGLRWGQAQTPTFKAAFSRAMRTLYARNALIPVRMVSLIVRTPYHERRGGMALDTYRRRATDQYATLHPSVQVGREWWFAYPYLKQKKPS